MLHRALYVDGLWDDLSNDYNNLFLQLLVRRSVWYYCANVSCLYIWNNIPPFAKPVPGFALILHLLLLQHYNLGWVLAFSTRLFHYLFPINSSSSPGALAYLWGFHLSIYLPAGFSQMVSSWLVFYPFYHLPSFVCAQTILVFVPQYNVQYSLHQSRYLILSLFWSSIYHGL
jgi:hypothetical protein